MAEFRIENYDKGGMNAIAGDKKLTGNEVKKAVKDGYNVWDGYTANDPVPERTVKEETKAKKYIDFDKFDIGGKDAIAGDEKLTGDELTRAIRAGYNVSSLTTKEDIARSQKANTDYGAKDEVLLGTLVRAVAEKTPNKLAQGATCLLEVLLAPITLPISLVQEICNDN